MSHTARQENSMFGENGDLGSAGHQKNGGAARERAGKIISVGKDQIVPGASSNAFRNDLSAKGVGNPLGFYFFTQNGQRFQ